MEQEFGNVGFFEGGNRSTQRKPLRAEKKNQHYCWFNPHIASSPVIDPEPHRWEASVLTTAPSLLHPCLIGNLSTCDIETRTVSESDMFSFIARLHTITFTMVSTISRFWIVLFRLSSASQKRACLSSLLVSATARKRKQMCIQFFVSVYFSIKLKY